jgi:hypothetical protein
MVYLNFRQGTKTVLVVRIICFRVFFMQVRIAVRILLLHLQANIRLNLKIKKYE